MREKTLACKSCVVVLCCCVVVLDIYVDLLRITTAASSLNVPSFVLSVNNAAAVLLRLLLLLYCCIYG